MAEEFNLSVENEVYDISFNEETSEIIVDIQDNVTAINVDFHQGYYPLPNEGSGSSDWNDITNKPSTFPPSAHTHPISEVTNLQTTLDNKVDKVIGKQLSTEDYTTAEKNKLAGIQSGAEVNVNADWNAISGDAHILNKPSTFTPSTHTHEISDINNLQVSLENKLDKPTSDGTYLVKKTGDIISYEIFYSVDLSNYYTKTETYSQTEINGFLSGKQNSIGYTPENVENKSDSYTISSSTTYASTKALVDGLDTKLDKGGYTGNAQDLKNDIDGKANISHTHDISSITNLQTSLNLKEDLSNKAIDFSVVNDILYPSVKAVDDFVKSQRLEVPFANATSVTINHNLDKLCSVTISLDDGSFALCDYYNIDNNNIRVEFSTQQTGKIILI